MQVCSVHACAMRRMHGSSELQRQIAWIVAIHVQGFLGNDVNGVVKSPFFKHTPFLFGQKILQIHINLLHLCPSSLCFVHFRFDFHTFQEPELRGAESLLRKPRFSQKLVDLFGVLGVILGVEWRPFWNTLYDLLARHLEDRIGLFVWDMSRSQLKVEIFNYSCNMNCFL